MARGAGSAAQGRDLEFNGAMKKGPLVGWLVYIGDEILPSYIGTIIDHEIRIPIFSIQDSIESRRVLFSWLNCWFQGSPKSI